MNSKQKSEVPVLGNLLCPPFESELKRVTMQKTTATTKPQALSELGTSVAPRQRPKGSVSSQNLPLVLPSSPSPRNMIASPSPQGLQINEMNFESGDNVGSILQNSTPVSPYTLQPKIPIANVLQKDLKTPVKSNANENMFEATFADSFSSTTILPQTQTSTAKKEIVSPTSPMHQKSLNAPKVVDNRLAGGHRRNMSDTSAFNKYSFIFYICFLW